MISHERFGELRLAHFLPHAELVQLSDWEFMGCTWLGEALGFSEWLRLETDPEVLRYLSLDFAEFPVDAATSVLETLGLPVRPGMQATELRVILGDSAEVQRFVESRASYEFLVGDPPRFTVSCTVLEDGGLSYLGVMAPLQDPGAA